jgi:hypothetical protein
MSCRFARRLLANAICQLLQYLKANVFEMHDHSGIVQLQLDHALVEAFFGWQMFCELRGKLAVNVELKIVAFGDYVNRIPISFIDIFGGHSVFDTGLIRLIVGVNHQPVAAKTVVLLATRCMEIPCAQNLLTFTNVA